MRSNRTIPLVPMHRVGVHSATVDLQNRQLLMFLKPVATGYQTAETADVGHPITLPGLADCTVDLAGLF